MSEQTAEPVTLDVHDSTLGQANDYEETHHG